MELQELQESQAIERNDLAKTKRNIHLRDLYKSMSQDCLALYVALKALFLDAPDVVLVRHLWELFGKSKLSDWSDFKHTDLKKLAVQMSGVLLQIIGGTKMNGDREARSFVSKLRIRGINFRNKMGLRRPACENTLVSIAKFVEFISYDAVAKLYLEPYACDKDLKYAPEIHKLLHTKARNSPKLEQDTLYKARNRSQSQNDVSSVLWSGSL